MSGWVPVSSAGRWFAVPAASVETVCEVAVPVTAPVRSAAIRGVVTVGGRLLPLAHLAALVHGGTPPVARGVMGIVVRDGARRAVLEVDEAPGFERGEPEPLPQAWRGGWAAGAVRHAGTLIPLLDVNNLFERLTSGTETS